MKSVVSKLEGLLTAGSFLPGVLRFPTEQHLDHARLRVRRPATGRLVLQLTVDGARVGRPVTVPHGDGEWTVQVTLGITLPADSVARWEVVSFSGGSGDEATFCEIATAVARWAFARSATLPVPLELVWVEGIERLVLWTYDYAGHEFTESRAGITTGRAVLTVENERMAVEIGGLEVLVADAGVLHALQFRQGAPRGPGPRLEWWRGQQRLGALTYEGVLWVPVITQVDAVTAADGFDFRGTAEAPVAHLGTAGLEVLGLSDDL
jgi:hypothetical protein